MKVYLAHQQYFHLILQHFCGEIRLYKIYCMDSYYGKLYHKITKENFKKTVK